MQARASIIIPAHNEATVISRCLKAIYDSSEPGEFEVLVVCNGCTDDTVSIVRKLFPLVRLLETPIASKVFALNLGDTEASCFPRIYLDADLVVGADSLRVLIGALQSGEALAACGRMEIDASRSNWFVQSFYKVWRLNSYLEKGKFGGLFAVSLAGHSRISPFAAVTNDDEMVRRKFTTAERAYVEGCYFDMTAPKNLSGLAKIRTRAIRGNAQLDKIGLADSDGPASARFVRFLLRLLQRPTVWPALAIYIAFSSFIHAKLAFSGYGEADIWERDDSSRELI